MLGIIGGAAVTEAPFIAAVLLTCGGLLFTIGAVAKGVCLGMAERGDEQATETDGPWRPRSQRGH